MTTIDITVDFMTTPLEVQIAGAGIGGLALAAGLRRNGIAATVYDRDVDPAATGGYHITLNGPGQASLRSLVEPVIMERLLASASAVRLREPDAFWDRRGRLVGFGPDLAADPSIDIDRITLRLLLAEAAGDSVRLGRTVSGVAGGPEQPALIFDDGSRAVGDLVVGADGPHSVVARHLAGGPTNQPTGIIGWSGRTALDALEPDEQQRLGPRSSMVIGPHAAALYVGFLDPVGRAVLDAPNLRMSVTAGPTYIWGAMFPESARTDALRDRSGPELRDGLLALFAEQGWGEVPLRVLRAADPASIAAFRFNAASRNAQDLAPWPAGRVTALGDAVHATPPTAGMGAGTAIRDAADLVEKLVAVRDGEIALPVAISDFEFAMRQRGSEVLKISLQTVDRILATNTRLGAAATAMIMPLLAAGRRARTRRPR